MNLSTPPSRRVARPRGRGVRGRKVAQPPVTPQVEVVEAPVAEAPEAVAAPVVEAPDAGLQPVEPVAAEQVAEEPVPPAMAAEVPADAPRAEHPEVPLAPVAPAVAEAPAQGAPRDGSGRRSREERRRNARREEREARREEARREERRADNESARQPNGRIPQPQVGPQTRGLTLLGAKSTVYSDHYTPAILESFENRHPGNDFFVKFNCPEFTSLCPITGQPDFATLYISYIPDRRMVESKSLKLYLFSFRNHGAFHEDCVNMILEDLVRLLAPRYIEVWGKFLPRGGLSIDPYANYGRPATRWEEFARQRLLMHDLSPERVDNR